MELFCFPAAQESQLRVDLLGDHDAGPSEPGLPHVEVGGILGGQLQTLQTVLHYLTSLLPSNSIFLTNGCNQNWDVGFHEVLSKGERG